LNSLKVLKRVLALALALIACSHVLAAYPDRPIKVIVPFAPGGGTDLVARTLGVPMSEDLKQSIVIDNKPGGSTIIGTDALAKSPADGYTLVVATLAHAVNPSLYRLIAHTKHFQNFWRQQKQILESFHMLHKVAALLHILQVNCLTPSLVQN
jgi:tripartite-type tricarboxylate transporter receptor subunit TctC